MRRKNVAIWMALDPTQFTGRLEINIHPLAVVTAVSNHIGDDGAAGGFFFREVDPIAVVGVVVGVW